LYCNTDDLPTSTPTTRHLSITSTIPAEFVSDAHPTADQIQTKTYARQYAAMPGDANPSDNPGYAVDTVNTGVWSGLCMSMHGDAQGCTPDATNRIITLQTVVASPIGNKGIEGRMEED
jgi:hypothetical protein